MLKKIIKRIAGKRLKNSVQHRILYPYFSSKGLWGVGLWCFLVIPAKAHLKISPFYGKSNVGGNVSAVRSRSPIFPKLNIPKMGLMSRYAANRLGALNPVDNLFFNSTDIRINVTNNLQGSRVNGSTIGSVTLNTPYPWPVA